MKIIACVLRKGGLPARYGRKYCRTGHEFFYEALIQKEYLALHLSLLPPSGRVRSGYVLVSPLHQSLQQPREPHHLQHLESGPQVAARSFRPCKHSFKPAAAAKIAFNYCFEQLLKRRSGNRWSSSGGLNRLKVLRSDRLLCVSSRIEKRRTVVPALLGALENRRSSEVNLDYFYRLLFTTENLKLVHIVCHKKEAHNLPCDRRKVFRQAANTSKSKHKSEGKKRRFM